MSWRKIKAPTIFDGYRFVQNQVLVISDKGVVEGLIAEDEAGQGVENYEGLLAPGFINCHCHLELSHMKGLLPEKTGLVDFVFKIVTERHHSEEEILEAIAKAEEEMLQNGIVAVGDICNNALTISQKQKGRLHYYNFIEASGWLPAVSKTRFKRAKSLSEEFSILNSQFSISPHAPYSVSENLWKEMQPYFENKTVSIHNQETAFEDEFFLQGTGDFSRMYKLMDIDNAHYTPTKKSSLQSYFDKLIKARNIILVHNTFTKQEDIKFVNCQSSIINELQTTNHKLQTYFCLCVNANQYIENALPPVELFRKNNCTIVLGTDSLASNWSLNILDEIKMIRKNFPSASLEEILQWATSNGAKALQADGELGSFEKGKRPGVNLVDEKKLSVKKLI